MDGQLLVPVSQYPSGEETAELGHTAGLPAELLIDIFSLLPFWDRVRAATVCRRWRSVSLEAAWRLWSTLVAPGEAVTPCDLDACRGLLDRARGTLVTFIVPDMFASNYEELDEIIFEHLNYIGSLDITLLPHPFASWGMSLAAASTFQAAAPVLQRLRIDNRERVDLNRISILRGRALNTIELNGLDLYCLRHCAGSRTLRTLIVDTHATAWDAGFSWSMICSLPLLETLAVAITNRDVPDLSDQRQRFPRTLKRLSLSCSTTTLRQLTRPRYFSRLARWQLSFINAGTHHLADLATIAPYLQLITPTVAAVQFDANAVHFLLADSAGRRGIFQGVQFDESWSITLMAATTLCLGGLSMLPSTVMDVSPSFPALEDLTLNVTPESSAFTSNKFKWPRLACPSLRAVRLRSASATREIPIAAIESLLRDSLDYGPMKLAALVLDSVHVSAHQGVNVHAALHDLAETVTILYTHNVWPECHLVWNTPWDEIVR